MKRMKEGGGDDFDAKYLGIVLILLNVVLGVVFVGSGVVTKVVKLKHRRDGGETSRGVSAYGVFDELRNSLGWGRKSEGVLALEDGNGEVGIELGEVYLSKNNETTVEINPMTGGSMKTNEEMLKEKGAPPSASDAQAWLDR